MKISTMGLLKRSLLASAALLFAFASAQDAQAQQSATVNVTATVANTLVLDVTNMNFGTLVLIGDDDTVPATASVALSTAGVLTPSSTSPAYASVFDPTGKSPAIIAISSGAPNAIVNATINNVTNPIFNSVSLNLGDFTSSFDGGITQTARTVGTAFPITLSATGQSTLNIGATVTTGSYNGPYPNGTYAGSFDVTFSY